MKKKLVYITILLFSIVIIPLCNEAYVSIPMLALMYCSPLLYIRYYKRLEQLDWCCLFFMLSIAQTAITHPETFRLSTVLYSCMYISMFMAFARFIQGSRFTAIEFNRLCRSIIFAYAIVIAFQQVGLVTGLPILNGSYNLGEGGFLKVNAFTAEASHTACVIVAISWGYIKSYELINNIDRLRIWDLWRYDKKLLVAFIYVMFGTSSVTCVLGAFMLSLYFIPRRYIFTGLLLTMLFFVIFLFSDLGVAVRIRTMLPALLELDAQSLFLVDASSAARIGPYLLYIKEFDITSINTWFGYGCDYGGLHAFSTMANADVEENMGVGGLINSMYDYGFIMLLSFLALLLRVINLKSFELFLFVTIFSVSPLNLHIFWVYFLVLVTIKYLKSIKYISNENLNNYCNVECRQNSEVLS